MAAPPHEVRAAAREPDDQMPGHHWPDQPLFQRGKHRTTARTRYQFDIKGFSPDDDSKH